MLEEVNTTLTGYDVSTGKAHFNARTIYLLNYNEFVHNMEGNLAKGRVFLNPSHPADASSVVAAPSPSPRRLRIKWDDVTGIDGIAEYGNVQAHTDACYTLDGRRLNGKPTRKGLYITNGRKVVIK